MCPLWYEEQFYVVVGILLLISKRQFFVGALGLTALVAVLSTTIPKHLSAA
jgi:peptidoglycan/LPS O-acetylase OafA/YrhL